MPTTTARSKRAQVTPSYNAAMPAASTRSIIEERLRGTFDPTHLEIADESDRHAGHAGAAGGGGHYRVIVVAAVFEGRSRIERHRLVYDLLGDLMPGMIHALSLQALSPSEWGQ